jgi:hypothetical protein
MVFNRDMTQHLIPESTLRLDHAGRWITGMVGTFQVEALAFVEPSDEYGMPEENRISKLWVALPGTPRVVLYDFDRGDLDKNHLNAEGLSEMIAAVIAVVETDEFVAARS